jgi:hypothetical protein
VFIYTESRSACSEFRSVEAHPRRSAPLRHVTKNPSPQLLYFPHLQNRDSCKSFRPLPLRAFSARRIRSYEKCRVSPAFFRRSDVWTFRHSDGQYPRNSLPLNSFADPHPLNLYATILYKKGGERGYLEPAFQPLSRPSLSPLSATPMNLPASVANKRLTARLSLLDATFTKNKGIPPSSPISFTPPTRQSSGRAYGLFGRREEPSFVAQRDQGINL